MPTAIDRRNDFCDSRCNVSMQYQFVIVTLMGEFSLVLARNTEIKLAICDGD